MNVHKTFSLRPVSTGKSLPLKLREKNSNNADNHSTIKSTSKKEIIIAGDSIIMHMNEHEILRDDSVKIGCHPGATTDDITDYVRLTARERPDMISSFAGSNDIQNQVNTLRKVRKVITFVKEC